MNPYGILHSNPNSLSLHDHTQLSRMLQIPVVPQQMVVTPTITNSAMRALGTVTQDQAHMNGLSMEDHPNRMGMNQTGHRSNSAHTSSTGSVNPPDSSMHRPQNSVSIQDNRLGINQSNVDQRQHKGNPTSGNGNPNSHQTQSDGPPLDHHNNPHQSNQPTPSSTTLDLHQEMMIENFFEEADDRPHVCQVCHACYKTRTHLKRHMCIHLKARPYSCAFPECGKGFNRKEHANKHYDAVHRLSKFKCTFCAKEISRKDHLNRHIKNMHTFPLPPGGTRRAPGTSPARKKKGEGAKQTANNGESKSQLVNRCQQIDTNALLGNPPPQQYQQAGFPINGKNTSGMAGLLELFTCAECSSSFVSENDLTIHAKTHKPQPYKCSECSRAYTRREKLTEHVRCFHQGQKFSCDYCGKDLSRKDHVLRHVRSVHPEVLASQFVEMAESNGVDPASVISARSNNSGPNSQLPTSSTSSASSNPNNSNSIPSMGEMGALLKSVCHICLKVFGTSYHLARHVQSVHNQNMRPYACSYCSKQFKRKDHLTNHTKSHCNNHRDANASASAQISMANLISGTDALRQHAINSLQIEMLTPDDENKCVELPDSKGTTIRTGMLDPKYLKAEKPETRDECEAIGMTPSSSTQLKRGKISHDTNRNPTEHHVPYCAQCQIKFSSDGQLVHHLIQKHGSGGQESTLVKDTFQQSLWGRSETDSSGGTGSDPNTSRS